MRVAQRDFLFDVVLFRSLRRSQQAILWVERWVWDLWKKRVARVSEFLGRLKDEILDLRRRCDDALVAPVRMSGTCCSDPGSFFGVAFVCV